MEWIVFSFIVVWIFMKIEFNKAKKESSIVSDMFSSELNRWRKYYNDEFDEHTETVIDIASFLHDFERGLDLSIQKQDELHQEIEYYEGRARKRIESVEMKTNLVNEKNIS